MSKTKPEIAKAILERRNRMSHVILPGDMNATIGPDGVAEALKERWLVPDTDSGYLCATNDLVKVEEMRKLADMKPEAYKPGVLQVTEDHDLSMLHTKRRFISEIAAPGTGGGSPNLTSISQPAPAAPHPVAPPPVAPAANAIGSQGQGQGYAVGTPVTVARQGVSANGMIEKLMPDGRYSIGYPANVTQKPPGDNVFSKEELSLVPNNAQRPGVVA